VIITNNVMSGSVQPDQRIKNLKRLVTIGPGGGIPYITNTIMTTSKTLIVIAGILAAGFAFNTTFAQDVAKASDSQNAYESTVKKEKNIDQKVAKAAKAQRKQEMKAAKAVKAQGKAEKASKAAMKREKKQKVREQKTQKQKSKPQSTKTITPW
jgi:hypothetical protein